MRQFIIIWALVLLTTASLYVISRLIKDKRIAKIIGILISMIFSYFFCVKTLAYLTASAFLENGSFTLKLIYLTINIAVQIALFIQLGLKSTIWKDKYEIGFPLTAKSKRLLIYGAIGGLVVISIIYLLTIYQQPNMFIYGIGYLWWMLLGFCLWPIMEELVFRGRLYDLFVDSKNKNASLIITTVVYVLYMILIRSKWGEFPLSMIRVIAFTAPLGLIYAFIRKKTGNLWLSLATNIVMSSIIALIVTTRYL